MLKNSKMLLLSNLESLIHDPISDVKKTQGVLIYLIFRIHNLLYIGTKCCFAHYSEQIKWH